MKIPVFSTEEIKKLLQMDKVISSVERVYRLKASGETEVWPHICYHFDGPDKGVMDIKSGVILGDVSLHGAKILNTFWGNKDKDLPVFSGLLMVFDSTTGLPSGIMDASYITCMRTGAAGALGIKTFAREDSETLFVMGAGKQAVFQIAATLTLMPQFKTVYVADPLSDENAKIFVSNIASRMESEFGLKDMDKVSFIAATKENTGNLVSLSDAVITITPSREPLIRDEWISSGTHISCIGADMSGKEEIEPEIFKRARVYADDLIQCSHVGEMEIPLANGIIKMDDCIGEIGQVMEGKIPGRVNRDDVTIYDATGIALLDIVTAQIAIDASKRSNIGQTVEI